MNGYHICYHFLYSYLCVSKYKGTCKAFFTDCYPVVVVRNWKNVPFIFSYYHTYFWYDT